MGGTSLARARIAELKKKISHAESKKKEFQNYLELLKKQHEYGVIPYTDFLNSFYKKHEGKNVREWIEHLERHILECKRELNGERAKLLGRSFIFIFFALFFVSIILVPVFLLQPRFIGFSVQNEFAEENLTGQIANISNSEEINGEVLQNETSPSQEESLQPSENITANESSVSGNLSLENAILNLPGNETGINQTQINESQNIPMENFTTNETISIENIPNVTEINQTIQNTTEQNITKDLILENASINTVQLTPKIRLGESVKWKKTISSDSVGNATITLPENSENITITKVKGSGEEDITSSSSITGAVIGGSGENFIFRFLKNILGRITGKAVDESQNEKEVKVEIEIDEIQAEYEVEYETPAPYSIETEKENGKEVKIFGPETVHYEDVLAFTNLNENLNVKNSASVKIKWIEQNIYINPESVQDKDENGIYDYVEWNVPSLSEQTFEIIVITKAEHLDSNRNFISDIYSQVFALDGIWSEQINDNEFVRVTFEKNLTDENDITIYPRITSGNPKIEVYENNQNDLIAEFSSLNENEYNKIYLTNLISESQDVFDLKIIGGSLEFEHIVDPIEIAFFDNFETNLTLWNGNGATLWLWNTTQSVSVTHSVAASNGHEGDLVSDPIDTANATSINISFWMRDVALESTDIDLYFFDGISATYQAQTESLEAATDSTWTFVSFTTTNSSFFASNFSVQFNANLGTGGELFWIDNFYVNKTTAAPDATPPSLNITVPAANNTNVRNTTVNFSFTDAGGRDSAWYSNDSFTVNLSLGSGGTYFNITNITWSQGTHAVRIYANDTNNNLNATEEITFTIDSVAPNLNITSPTTNKTNTTDINLDILFNFSDVTLTPDSCFYGNDTFTVANLSLGSGGFCANITNITWSQGTHALRLYANDTLNNVNLSTLTFTVDNVAPALNITSPVANNTNSSNNLLDVLFTILDSSLTINSVWYSNDSYSVNLSLGSAGVWANITNITWSEGIHNVRIYANDTLNNLNESMRTFTIDTFGPAIDFTALTTANGTYFRNSIDVNVTANDSTTLLTGINISLFNSAQAIINSSFSPTIRIYSSFALNFTNLGDGIYFLNASANDSVNNRNFSETRSYLLDTTAPAVNITNPAANKTNVSDNLLDILYTRSDLTTLIESCWYSNDTFSVANYSLGSGGTCVNITNITWSEGTHAVRLYVNDSLNNLNESTITFMIDSIAPSLNITSPVMNNTNTTDILTDILLTISELGTNVESVWYSNDSFGINLSLGSAGVWTNITNITWSQGSHNVRIYVNDSANNVNLSTITFTIDAQIPFINFTSPTTANGSYSRNSIDVNVTANDTITLLTGINITLFHLNGSIYNSSFSATSSFALNFTNLLDGTYILNASANDTLNNKNYTESRGYVLDTTAPEINIIIPAQNNTNTTDNQQDVNFTFLDALIGVDSCWYSNDTYSINLSLGSGGTCQNITNITWSVAIHNVTIYANDTLGNLNYTTRTINVSSANEAPTIPTVYNITVQTPTENGFTNVSIFFVANDANGAADLVNATANFTINKSGEENRYSANCDPINGSGNSVTYNCSLKMWYFDLAGLWTVNVSVLDVAGTLGVNNSTGFVYDTLTAMTMSPIALSWPEIFANNTINITSNNDPIIVNNTGNDVNDINVNAIDLQGEISGTEYIRATNFSVAINLTSDSTGCAGNLMANATDTNITSGFLYRGNNTLLNNGTSSGQQQLYFCLRYLNTSLSFQPYSAHTDFAWTVKTLLAFAAIPRRRKNKNRDKLGEDRLLETISLLVDEFKERHKLSKEETMNLVIKEIRKKYKINRSEILELSEVKKISIPATIFSGKIGMLESLVKYMKENLEMSYKEIAGEISRDERTVWTSYKKAVGKQPEKIEEKETDMTIPLSIFKEGGLTVLESVVIYLKEKGMKYSEIGKLLGRDQRNIWAVYSKAKKKSN